MKKLGDLLKRMGTAAATSADKLTAINPPADLKTVHQDIIGEPSIGPLMIKGR